MVLVLKCLAHRLGEDDDEDVRLLASKVGLTDPEQVLALLERLVKPSMLTPQVRFFVEAVLGEEPEP